MSTNPFLPAAAPDAISDVAVIGGGIVGAAAALAAAHAGLSTVWVAGRDAGPDAGPDAMRSAASAPLRDARVYALAPATQRFLERLRVWSQLDASRLAPVFDMRVFGDAGARAALHFGAYEAATERLATIVEHRELARVLDTAAAYFPGIDRIDGFAAGVSASPDHVAIDTDRGQRRARLVVAADGAASPTRDALGIAADTRAYGQRASIGNFACTRPHAGNAFQWFTDDGVVALLPLAAGPDAAHAVSLVWSAPDDVAAELVAAGPDAVAARLTAIASTDPKATLGTLTSLGPIAQIPLSMQSAQRTIAPRAVLVGDAAHVVHPLAGQGLNLGLADVDVLVALLVAREPFRDCGDRVVLRRYERARAEPVLAMRQVTDGLARLFGRRQPGVALLRGIGMRLLDRATPVKRALVRQASGNA